MRISAFERNEIKKVISEVFSPEDKVILFGSRADDSKRGGDIDLLVITRQNETDVLKKKISAVAAIQLKIGLQKIDLVTACENEDFQSRLILREAISKGIEL